MLREVGKHDSISGDSVWAVGVGGHGGTGGKEVQGLVSLGTESPLQPSTPPCPTISLSTDTETEDMVFWGGEKEGKG